MKKKVLLTVFFILFIATANAFAVTTVDLQCSNALPDGNDYATVTIEVEPGACSGYDGVKITVDANQSVLIPGSNFGIQKFGFNYNGDHSDMQITVYQEDGITVDSSWTVQHSHNISEFGCFVEEPQGTGNHRHDPLIIIACKPNTNLIADDFNVANGAGYNFAAHIADFTFGTTYYGTNSAFFANCPSSTLITLASFTATADHGSVKLEWVTEAEIDTAGFNLYRIEQRKRARTVKKINDELIPAKGSSTQGASYEFIDDDVQNWRICNYVLEDIDLSGTRTFHGPVKVIPMFKILQK